MQSKATTVEQYLAELPEDRRTAIMAVREIILANLDTDYEEGMQYGMIGYFVPHRIYPAGYHCDPKQPLPFACLASLKNYMSLYMMSVYATPEQEKQFREAWTKSGKKLDMGKSCIRFKKLEDVALDVIGQAIRNVPVTNYIDTYETIFKNMRKKTDTSKPARPKAASAAKPATTKAVVAKKATVKNAATKKSPAKKAASSATKSKNVTSASGTSSTTKKPSKKGASKKSK